MKIKKGFVLREMCGDCIVLAESLELIDFNKLIHLNESAVYLWQQVEGREFDVDTLAGLLVDKYGIGKEQALSDATSLYKTWLKAGLVEA
ncbi:PqqD family protein [Parabacteroides johnsonii]